MDMEGNEATGHESVRKERCRILTAGDATGKEAVSTTGTIKWYCVRSYQKEE